LMARTYGVLPQAPGLIGSLAGGHDIGSIPICLYDNLILKKRFVTLDVTV
jgi:hypothetical protein